MGLQCQTLRGIGGYEYTENDKKRNENHISLFVFANFNFDTYNSLTPNWYYKVLR